MKMAQKGNSAKFENKLHLYYTYSLSLFLYNRKIMMSLCKSCLLVISIYSTRLGEEEEERGREGS